MRRLKKQPRLTFPSDLPITAKKDEIIDAIKKNRVIIVSGETGSGKTTQIPKFCLAAGQGIDGRIGCTQPRRIAAVTVAKRIAKELGENIGKTVGYKIRFYDKTSKETSIKIMTDGVLLAETLYDRFLNQYDTIIVDEAHERSLNIDFVLGFLKTLLNKKKGLKVIITSATIDTEKFSKAFYNAPVIEVTGRMFPVEVRYFPDDMNIDETDEKSHIEMAVDAVDILLRETISGDLLIFMPTEQDIRETRELIEGRHYPGVLVLPLFARMQALQQSKVFASISKRKIIIATNMAETSITIPGIKYVIDTGLARILQYSPRSRITSLPVVPISKSSADQRKGRCGRVENGVCIRLYPEEDFNARPLFTLPEIIRTNLAEVILKMMALKLGDITDFPFIDKPALKNIKDGINLLAELGAIIKNPDCKKHKSKIANRYMLTRKGRLMAKIPLDPRLSRALIEARKLGCTKEIAIIVSALSIQDPRERPAKETDEADQKHRLFSDHKSDFITLLNIWNSYHDTWEKVKSTNQMKKFCRQHFLSFKRMREWRDIHDQVTTFIKEYDHSKTEDKAQKGRQKKTSSKILPDTFIDSHPLYTQIHKSILCGFLSNIAVKKEKNIFKAAKDKEAMIFPSSDLFNRAGKWIVASEMLETSRLFAIRAANIDSEWLEEMGGDLCKYTYSDPHWEKNREEVVAYEQVSLFGLIIEPKRPVSYGKVDPEKASEIFIKSALVQGDIKEFFPFMKYNKRLVKEVKEMENRLRRRDILIDDEDLFVFYQKRLDSVYDVKTLSRLIKKRGSDNFLRMTKEDLVRYHPGREELSLFPNNINLGGEKFKCAYKFDPGKPDDGITIKIPSSQASGLHSDSIDWLVPGLYREKITELIKGLPKRYRKQLVPLSATVDLIVDEMEKNKSPLITEIGQFIYKRFGVDIPADAWPDESLPDHLRARIAITDRDGKVIKASKNKNILFEDISLNKYPEKSNEFIKEKNKWEKTGITKWDFPNLPDRISIKGKDGAIWYAYPALTINQKDKVKSVDLRLFTDRQKALKSHKQGILALFSICCSKDLKFFKKQLILPEDIRKKADYFGGYKMVEKMIYEKVLQNLFLKDIRSKDAFYTLIESAKKAIFANGRDLLKTSVSIIDAFCKTRLTIFEIEKKHKNKSVSQFLEGLMEELNKLVPKDFVKLYDTARQKHITRYIAAIGIRAQRALFDFNKDKEKAKSIKMFTDKLQRMLQGLSPTTSDKKRESIEEFYWQIEEYKVSVFAQEIKTASPVSPKRLINKIKEIERIV